MKNNNQDTFQQSERDKRIKKMVISKHNYTLRKFYGDKWKKFLNLPDYQLEQPVRMSF